MHRRTQHVITVAIFAGVLGVLILASWAGPQRTSSDLEARNLAIKPAFNAPAFLSGQYAKDWESYLSDHVAFRDTWLKTYAFVKLRVLGESDMNGVVVGKDGYMLQLPARLRPYDARVLDAVVATASTQVSELDAFVKARGGRFLYVTVPSKDSFDRSYFPFWVKWRQSDAGYPKFFAALARLQVDGLDMQKVMEPRRNEQLYYRTDHHWTFPAVFLAYTTVVERLGLEPLALEDFEVTTLPNPFIGAYNRQLGMAFPTNDHAVIATPKVPVPFTKTADGKPSPRLYFTERDPAKPISYAVYMGGDVGEIVIDTNRPRLPSLLLVGDSCTNALEPLIFLNFDETRVLDLRMYHDMSLFDYVATHKPDVVIVMQSGYTYLVHAGNGDFGKPSTATTASQDGGTAAQK